MLPVDIMGKRFSAKRELKRHNTPQKKFVNNKRVKHSREFEGGGDVVTQISISSPTSADNESDSEELIYKERSMYDNLLSAFHSNKTLANAHTRRQRQEEGKSDSEEDETESSDSIDESEEKDSSEEEIDDKYNSMETKQEEHNMTDNEDVDENSESEIASDSDLEPDVGLDVESAVEASSSTSSFHAHLGYNLSQAEVENLLNQKPKYNWDVPATGIQNCKWVGTGECFLKENDVFSCNGLKQSLYKHWMDIYNSSGGNDFNSSKQSAFFSLFNSYRDVLHSNKKPFFLKGGSDSDSSAMDAYIMHSLNHIFKSRDLIKKNDFKKAKCGETVIDDVNFLDRGFTRPKILILLPFRNIAARVVKRLIQLTPQKYKVNVEYLDRFVSEFAMQDTEGDMSEELQSNKSSKPSDHQALFSGNCDDDFMIGIKFKGRKIKLYGDFYSSDMIVASPLKVHSKIGLAEVNKDKDVDFLSSIEVLIIDYADVVTMQNWAFLNPVLEQLNRTPSKHFGEDILRVRDWYNNGHARFYRQSIILSHYANPDINASFNRHCLNYQGKVKLMCDYNGVLPKVLLQVRQIYERFDVKSMADIDDARLEYFTKKVFPKIKDSIEGGIMLFVSSYFEYVRLRNFLKTQNASFCLLGDYTKPSDISRARVWFFQGRRKIMLYTERAHFYHRYKIRGIQNLIIYSLPERKEFYVELLNMLEGADNMACTVLFSRFDQLRLERIVGTSNAKRMAKSEKSMFVFC